MLDLSKHLADVADRSPDDEDGDSKSTLNHIVLRLFRQHPGMGMKPPEVARMLNYANANSVRQAMYGLWKKGVLKRRLLYYYLPAEEESNS